MAITSIAQTSASVSAFGNQAQGDGAPKNQNPLAALQGRVQTADPQLSVFGQVRRTLDDLQAQAQAARNLSVPPTLSEFTVAVQGVVQSFNALSRTVSAAAANREGSRVAAASVIDQRPAQALNAVRQAVEGPGGSSLAALREIGVSRQKDGSFEINQQQLEKAFLENRSASQATLDEVAFRVDREVRAQIPGNGNIGQRSSNLSEQVGGPRDAREDVQARLENQRNFQQLQAAQLARAGSFVARNAVATYLSVASL